MKQRKKRSLVWAIDADQLKEIVKSNNSIQDILKAVGVVIGGGSIKALKQRLSDEKIDYSHIPLGLGHNSGKTWENKNKLTIEQITTTGSTYSRTHLKARLIKDKILEEKCAICNLEPQWNNNKLVMVLDHINGVHNDNRLENLRLLCPNCNSQTDTFTGRNLKYKPAHIKKLKDNKRFCTKCEKQINKHGKNGLCLKCSHEIKRKTLRPLKETLIQKVKEQGYRATGREYGVSDNTIKKWLK